MKLKSIIVAFASLSFVACTSPNLGTNSAPQARVTYEKPTEAKLAVFHPVMTQVALSTKEDPNYKKMSLTTPEEKEWFHNLMYRLWDRQITKNQFISEGVAKYPTHRYEFTFVANGYQRYS
jgi:hypothetical protein